MKYPIASDPNDGYVAAAGPSPVKKTFGKTIAAAVP
jgi:hypothetical protein